ncbi:MAG: TIGR04211 family SH3 domain-containing protein [Woeseiaceae bacterium]
MNQKILLQAFLLIYGLGLSITASAQSAWVSDQFEVMLRTGPSTSNAIQLQVDSGTELEILGEDAEAGYTQVRTRGGTEGWVLTRYLMSEPSAREQLVTLTQQLTDATSDSSGLGSQLSALRGEFDSATRQIRDLEQDKTNLQQQLDDITEKAADTLAIDRQNQNLQQQLTDTEIQVSLLEQENEDLSGQTKRNWFITGALVLFGGVLLGLVLPRMKFQRRSRYDSF